jgi:drug/metabolite transporter (DMT)-like permease
MAVPIRRVLRDTGADTVNAIAVVCLAYVLMTVGDTAIKWALSAVGLAGVMIGRAAFGLPTVALLACLPGAPGSVAGWRRLRPVRWRMVALRSVVHSGASLTWYVAWQMGMSLADSYAIGFCTPLLMTVLAVPLLGERIHWRRAASTALGFAGVLVMLRPGGALWSPAALVMVAGIAPLALSRILIRMLATTETPECLSFWLMAAHLPVGLALWAFLPIPGLPVSALAALALVGLGNGMGHWLQSGAVRIHRPALGQRAGLAGVRRGAEPRRADRRGHRHRRRPLQFSPRTTAQTRGVGVAAAAVMVHRRGTAEGESEHGLTSPSTRACAPPPGASYWPTC